MEVTAILRGALLVVDVQRDFCPGGALPVRGGDRIIPGINRVTSAFARAGLPVFFTRDWHPKDHISFRSQGGRWPAHCVQGTAGAEFHPALRIPAGAVVISKGDDPRAEAYSGFQGTDLKARLKELGVKKVFLCGLATDYCVRETTIDARHAGFAVDVMEDCTRPVNAKPRDGDRAVSVMRSAGAKMTTSSAVIRELASTQQ